MSNFEFNCQANLKSDCEVQIPITSKLSKASSFIKYFFIFFTQQKYSIIHVITVTNLLISIPLIALR